MKWTNEIMQGIYIDTFRHFLPSQVGTLWAAVISRNVIFTVIFCLAQIGV